MMITDDLDHSHGHVSQFTNMYPGARVRYQQAEEASNEGSAVGNSSRCPLQCANTRSAR